MVLRHASHFESKRWQLRPSFRVASPLHCLRPANYHANTNSSHAPNRSRPDTCTSLKTLTFAALVAFFHVVQVSTIPPAWRTPYTIMCVLGLVPLVVSFIRGQTKTATLLLQFALILSVYEAVNLGRVVFHASTLSSFSLKPIDAPLETEPGTNSPHVFLLVFDEFSLVQIMKDELLDPDIIPNLAEFSGTATWYRKAVTNHGMTAPAIAALLTGRKEVGSFQQEFLERPTTHHLFSGAAKTHDVYISGIALPYCLAFNAYVSVKRHMLRHQK